MNTLADEKQQAYCMSARFGMQIAALIMSKLVSLRYSQNIKHGMADIPWAS